MMLADVSTKYQRVTDRQTDNGIHSMPHYVCCVPVEVRPNSNPFKYNTAQQKHIILTTLIVVALRSRCRHYIFALWFLLLSFFFFFLA